MILPRPLPMRYPSLDTATDPITTKSSETESSMPKDGRKLRKSFHNIHNIIKNECTDLSEP